MGYQEKMKELFREWVKAVPEYENKFISDGIIDEALYQQAKIKILYIMKEPNDPTQGAWHLADAFPEDKKLTRNFSQRLAEWSYGIFNEFPALNSLTDSTKLKEAFRSTAIINLKKSGGGASSNMAEIYTHTRKNKSFLQEQIKIISPDIIIGGVGQTGIWNYLFDSISFKQSSCEVPVFLWNKIKVIDFYHPSYRVPRSMSYSLLQNVFKCKIYNDLS